MDRISRLPDEVICHILSFLPTKHVVATSVLSSRWVNLWTFVPVIDLDDSLYLNPERQYQNPSLFVRFFERVSSMNESKTIVKFRLHMHSDMSESTQTLSVINGLIHNVFLKNVVEFDWEIYSYYSDGEYYLKIPHSESLKVLKIRADSAYCLKMPAFPGCFPSLRVFDAKLFPDENDELMTDLFPCLPALEKLCLDLDLTENSPGFTLNIGGAALKHLELQLYICLYDERDCVVVIDAPKLKYLRLHDTFLASYLVKHKPAISEVRLHVIEDYYSLDDVDGVDLPQLARFNKLLQGLVNAKFISVSASFIQDILSQDWNIPLLPSLTKLELPVTTSQRGWIWLLHWLESCPNLKVLSLIIKEEPVKENNEVVPDVVPSCLSSCVKEIKIKRVGKVDLEKTLIYFSYNAKVLDEFTVDSRVYIKDGIVQ